MKTFAITILVAFFTIITYWLPVPWYSYLILIFMTGLFTSGIEYKAFIAGFFGVSLLWAVMLIINSAGNDWILTNRMSIVFSSQMGTDLSPFWLIAVSSLLGGLPAGMLIMSGRLIMSRSNPDDSLSKGKHRSKKSGYYKLRLK